MESLKTQFRKTLRDLRNFTRREDGLVTVEWVALTAAMVISAVVVSYTVMHNTNGQANRPSATGLQSQSQDRIRPERQQPLGQSEGVQARADDHDILLAVASHIGHRVGVAFGVEHRFPQHLAAA